MGVAKSQTGLKWLRTLAEHTLEYQWTTKISPWECWTSAKSLIHGCRTNPIILAVFPNHSQKGSGPVGWLLVLQPCQDLYAYYLTHRWEGLRSGLLAYSAETHNSPKGAFICGWWWWSSHYVTSDSCDSTDVAHPPGSPIHGIFQARILEQVAVGRGQITQGGVVRLSRPTFCNS